MPQGRWYLDETAAGKWAVNAFDELGTVAADVASVLGFDSASSWDAEGGAADIDERGCPAWCATRQISEGDRLTTLSLSMDHASFTKDEDPIPDRFVVELAVIFGLDPRQQLPAAHRRALAAWRRCAASSGWAEEPLTYPNVEELGVPAVAFFDSATVASLEPRGIWAALRSAPFTVTSRAGVPAATRFALDGMRPLLREWEAAVHTTRGAVFATQPSLDLPTILGWCGEVVFWRREAQSRGMRWSPTWTTPYDFSSPRGELVEVKTTDLTGGGEFHLTAGEVALALRNRDQYSLVHVRVDLEAARRVREVLLDDPATSGAGALGGGVEAQRLADACGKNHEYVEERWSRVAALLVEIGRNATLDEEADPLGWLQPVAKELLARRAGLVLAVPVGQ